MVTYQFYKDVYLGSHIKEIAFPEMMARAEAWLSKIERTYHVEPVGEDSRAMALCSVAETMEVFLRRQDIAQTTVGGVTIRYENDRKLQRQLLQNAGVFLDIRRGVGA